jgi:hypothetical protein
VAGFHARGRNSPGRCGEINLVEEHWRDIVLIAEAPVKEQALDQERIEEILEAAASTNSVI